MNRIESFALQSALKIDKPFIHNSFFPITEDRYITFNGGSQGEGKKYHLFQEVVDLINPYLEKNNIGLYQLGVSGEQTFEKCNVLVGATNVNQASYVLSQSLIHFGVDGLLNHIASSMGKPVVALYSGLPPEVCSPYFNKKNKLVNLSWTDKDDLPSYNENESSKTINKIKPEEIALNILNFLKIDNDLESYKTVSIGDMYTSPIIECIPDFSPDNNFFPQSTIHLRLDYLFDEAKIPEFANGRNIAIITKKPIEEKYLIAVKKNISMVTYRVDENSDTEFVQKCLDLGLQLNLISSNPETISKTRLKFFEWPVRLILNKSKKDLDNNKDLCDNTLFKCKKTIYSKSGSFQSKYHWKQGIVSKDKNMVVDSPDFWIELDHLYLYNHDKKSKHESGSDG